MPNSYRTREGVALPGATPMEVVKSLRASAYDPHRDLPTFMAQVARGAELQTGLRIRCGNAADFIADLLAAGLIERTN